MPKTKQPIIVDLRLITTIQEVSCFVEYDRKIGSEVGSNPTVKFFKEAMHCQDHDAPIIYSVLYGVWVFTIDNMQENLYFNDETFGKH